MHSVCRDVNWVNEFFYFFISYFFFLFCVISCFVRNMSPSFYVLGVDFFLFYSIFGLVCLFDIIITPLLLFFALLRWSELNTFCHQSVTAGISMPSNLF